MTSIITIACLIATIPIVSLVVKLIGSSETVS